VALPLELTWAAVVVALVLQVALELQTQHLLVHWVETVALESSG
jgi:hypothetical protein